MRPRTLITPFFSMRNQTPRRERPPSFFRDPPTIRVLPEGEEIGTERSFPPLLASYLDIGLKKWGSFLSKGGPFPGPFPPFWPDQLKGPPQRRNTPRIDRIHRLFATSLPRNLKVKASPSPS